MPECAIHPITYSEGILATVVKKSLAPPREYSGYEYELDAVIGLNYLKAIHSNDSLNPLGAHKDRHARLGEGHIGLEAFRRIASHPKLQGLPFIMETPNDDEGWTKEIAMMRKFAEERN